MERFSYKRISNLLYLLGFICAALMLGNKTFGYRSTIHVIFYITGAGALVFSLLSARFEEKSDFNVLSWIGTLLVFLSFLLKTSTSYWMYVLIAGLAVTGFSYFINPSRSTEDEEEDQLLDR